MVTQERGHAVLARPDEWWLRQWAQVRVVDALAGRYGIPPEDVEVRLQRAGAELRGRRTEQLTLIPMPRRRWTRYGVSVYYFAGGSWHDFGVFEVVAATEKGARCAAGRRARAQWAEQHPSEHHQEAGELEWPGFHYGIKRLGEVTEDEARAYWRAGDGDE